MLLRSSLINHAAGARESTGKSVTINAPAKDEGGSVAAAPSTAATSAVAAPPKPAAYTREALKALGGGIADSIVDLHVSENEAQEQVLSRNGYVQLLQDPVLTNTSNNAASLRKSTSATPATTTFSNKTSLWLWRRSQGTCSGRLKPIIDVLLYPSAVSSDLVLAGYTCAPVAIAGQYLWTKRASSEEEEKDALIDLFVTTGRMRDASDPVWQTPGVGWIRVDGNFTKSLFGSIDSFLWFRPARSRSMDMQMTNPLKGVVSLTEEVRQARILAAVRVALRHYVPVTEVKQLAQLSIAESQQKSREGGIAAAMSDFSSVFHRYEDSKGRMTASRWNKLLHDVGLNMKTSDASQCFNVFDLNHNGTIAVEEYSRVLTLTDYELDLALEKIRLKLLFPCIPRDLRKSPSMQINSSTAANGGGGSLLRSSQSDVGVLGAQAMSAHPYTGKNKIRENMTLSQIFRRVNGKADGLLSLEEIMDLSARVEVFLTEEEARKVGNTLDMNHDDRVDEKDFISFMSRDSLAIAKKAFRVREAAALLRRWLVRGSSEKSDGTSTATASKAQWKYFKQKYERSTGQKFPGFLSARVLELTLAAQGLRLSATETRELSLVVAPERSGRVYLAELHAFMSRGCRSFGELVTLLQRDVLSELVESYVAHRVGAKSSGREEPALLAVYRRKLEEIKRVIESVYRKHAQREKERQREQEREGNAQGDLLSPLDDALHRERERDEEQDDDDLERPSLTSSSLSPVPVSVSADPAGRLRGKSDLDILPIAQLKLGMEEFFTQQQKVKPSLTQTQQPQRASVSLSHTESSAAALPNLEEWACLSILVDADVTEGDVYGVRLKAFLEGLCAYIYSTQTEAFADSLTHALTEKESDHLHVEVVRRELQVLLYREARLCALAKKAKQPDYAAVFALFDENRNGVVSLDEFKRLLRRYQLVDLSETQFEALLSLIDRRKRGEFDCEDLRVFAEDVAEEEGDLDAEEEMNGIDNPSASPLKKRVSSSTVHERDDYNDTNNDDFDTDDNDVDEDTLLLSDNGGAPPVPVTKNADCDWLAWFLYRQAYRAAPGDAESQLADLEALCTETEVAQNTRITVKDFWAILQELKLRGRLTPEQFLVGVSYVCDYPKKDRDREREGEREKGGAAREEDTVDYAALCAYAIRMGRAFLRQAQEKNKAMEKKFPEQMAALKSFFQALCEEDKSATPRYEKVFRRMDSDGDGFLTPLEFRRGLKRLRFEHASQWTQRACRRLFDECDRNRDGLLSIKEFSLYVLDRRIETRTKPPLSLSSSSALHNSHNTAAAEPLMIETDKLNLSEPEDNDDGSVDVFHAARRTLTDAELIRKVNDVLADIVPREHNATTLSHLETVRASVRKFFTRADVEHRGVVSEERFRAFLRRTGLQDALTAGELGRLTAKLRRRGSGRERDQVFIDYERLCRQLIVATESIPKSKAEEVFNRFQNAAISSASAGRAFLSLCSLFDRALTGRVAREDLLSVAKMMDCELAPFELEAMLEVVPSVVINAGNNNNNNNNNSTYSHNSREQVLIDYRALNGLLETHTPRDMDDRLFSSFAYTRRSNAAFAMSQSTPTPSLFAQSLAVNTPFGQSIQTPLRATQSPLTSTGLGMHSNINTFSSSSFAAANNSTAYEKIVRVLADRLRQAIDDRSRLMHSHANTRFSLRRELESMDMLNSGLVSVRSLQMVTQEVGVVLTSSELQALTALYGRADEEKIFYDSFCRMVESANRDRDRDADMLAISMSAASISPEPYITNRVLLRLRELKQEGRNPMDMFEVYDLDRTGLVPVSKFKDVVYKLQLLQTEHQVVRAIEDFCAAGNRSYVSYEDFCAVLEKSYRNSNISSGDNHPLSATMGNTSSRRNNVVDGDGFDGFRATSRNTVSQQQHYDESFPSARDDPRELYESLHRTANQQGSRKYSNNNNGHNYTIELDQGSDVQSSGYDNALFSPKVSDSIALSRRPASPTRLSRSSFDPFASTSSSLARPRTSPSKVGSKMWGNDTPLARKGNVPHVSDDKWCCAVCLYIDNPVSAQHCVVCDSPNYNNNKDYQLKEQCKNCTFLNGQFAEECEMCGEPLSHHKSVKKNIPTPSTSKSRSRNAYY